MSGTIEEIIAGYRWSSPEPLPAHEWTNVLTRAVELCVAGGLDPARIEYVRGPDEWQHEDAPIENGELEGLVSIIDREETGLHSLVNEHAKETTK
jgi:hypothetical protein